MSRTLVLTCVIALVISPAAFSQGGRDAGAPIQVTGTCPTDACPAMPPTLITGSLGSCGDWPNCTSGLQTGRLNRNGIGSTCAAPKLCDIFLTDPGRDYDAYVIPNNSGSTACVTVELTVLDQTGCNLQIDGYLNTYDPLNICEPESDYLADAGLSSGMPPNPSGWCADVPDGDDLILVVHPITPGTGSAATTRSVCRAPASQSSCRPSRSSKSSTSSAEGEPERAPPERGVPSGSPSGYRPQGVKARYSG